MSPPAPAITAFDQIARGTDEILKSDELERRLALGRPMDDLCRDLQRNARRPPGHLVASEHMYTIGSCL